MSFASDIKAELRRIDNSTEMTDILCKGAAFAMNEDDDNKRSFKTESKKTRDYVALCLKDMGVSCKKTSVEIRGTTLHTLSLTDNSYGTEIPDCSDDDKFSAFLRGVFLVCGGAADPEKSYQLEFFLHSKEKCDILKQMIEEHGMTAKLSKRRGSHFLYIKESEKISDILTFMGAMMQSMEIMNVKIYKEVKNNVNRSVNCEAANLTKTIDAANNQADDIQYIFDNMGESYLSEELLQVARIRLSSRELSLSDIGAMLEPPISRSGVNHRLKKISSIAEKLRQEKELNIKE